MLRLEEVAAHVKKEIKSKSVVAVLSETQKIFNFEIERHNKIRRFVKIINSYASGVQVKEIVNEFSCSRSTVLRYARLSGLAKRPKHFPKEIKEAVIRDYVNGIPVAQIAELHGVSEPYVSMVAQKHGIGRYDMKRHA